MPSLRSGRSADRGVFEVLPRAPVWRVVKITSETLWKTGDEGRKEYNTSDGFDPSQSKSAKEVVDASGGSDAAAAGGWRVESDVQGNIDRRVRLRRTGSVRAKGTIKNLINNLWPRDTEQGRWIPSLLSDFTSKMEAQRLNLRVRGYQLKVNPSDRSEGSNKQQLGVGYIPQTHWAALGARTTGWKLRVRGYASPAQG
ncbi:hypothetical protein DFH08DRAFT_822818 [Mycena albidolilacea]|uniref:Uncharacterized protein n=1 Tax=Mycena albidolilacea TaxID=1033008 RepID=A0AAD6Z7Q9_9AGAR|nr:hypothetical protein DFH08DRAFT_822818 [Mycena albidolilacea]